ncbi:MAG: tryptophan--tRNA ligase [Candidatus Gribaldobacteria bacterium]|nr:tryptophan--tRNA ligase [Candidatus Gribaldobacteria bacterium]
MKVFSGIQPTNELHIGNYLGAIKQWVDLQNQAECVFCIVDWHAITVPYDTKVLQTKIHEVAAVYLASGIDPQKSIIFVQSQVKEHAELAWLLNTITPLGDLQRMTQFKDKSAKFLQNINAGLLNYPVLMAADVLLYQTDVVPVGEDQKQHVELTREIARRFNSKFSEVFKLPKAQIPKIGARIMSLTEPTKKMSKTDKAESRIGLFDSPEQIKEKIGSATTDSGKEIRYNPKEKPGISNLLTIYSSFSNQSIKDLEKEFTDQSYQLFKQKLADLLIETLEPFRAQKAKLESNPSQLNEILTDGANHARAIAQDTIQKARSAMGLN